MRDEGERVGEVEVFAGWGLFRVGHHGAVGGGWGVV